MTFVDDRQLDLFGGHAPAVDDDETDPIEVGVWPMDCANVEGFRPCPRVTCRHHLLLDEIHSGDGKPSLAINRAGSIVRLRGRRPELAPDASRADFDEFAGDAIAALWRIPDTCAREVARRYRQRRPDATAAMTTDEMAAVLGVADPESLSDELAEIIDGIRGEVYAAGGEDSDDLLGMARR